jgi:hypothetical protein
MGLQHHSRFLHFRKIYCRITAGYFTFTNTPTILMAEIACCDSLNTVNVLADHVAASTMAAKHMNEVRAQMSEPDLQLLRKLASSTLPQATGMNNNRAPRGRSKSMEVSKLG